MMFSASWILPFLLCAMQGLVQWTNASTLVVHVSSEEEFNEAVGDFTTIVLTSDIFISYRSGPKYMDNYSGIIANNTQGLVIEGGGHKIDGRAQDVDPNWWDQRCFTIIGGNVTINDLVVENCASMDGALSIYEGADVLIENSHLTKNLNGLTGGSLTMRGFGVAKIPHATLVNVTIDHSSSDTGGGIYASGDYRDDKRPTLRMVNCKVTDNVAINYGGGLYGHGVDVFAEGVFFAHNTGNADSRRYKNEVDVFADMTASCSDCWSTHYESSPCPNEQFVSIDEGLVNIEYYPSGGPSPDSTPPHSYTCVPKEN